MSSWVPGTIPGIVAESQWSPDLETSGYLEPLFLCLTVRKMAAIKDEMYKYCESIHFCRILIKVLRNSPSYASHAVTFSWARLSDGGRNDFLFWHSPLQNLSKVICVVVVWIWFTNMLELTFSLKSALCKRWFFQSFLYVCGKLKTFFEWTTNLRKS